VYFYRWGEAGLLAKDFANGVTYQRCMLLGHRALIMDLNAEEGNNYQGEYAGKAWVAHGRLQRVNVGYIDGSVQDYPASELKLLFPAGSYEELQWFGDADARYQ
jgi:hypothetical protein